MRRWRYSPAGYAGSLDPHLERVTQALRRRLTKAQDTFAYDSLVLEPDALAELARILVGFAVDVHCDIGIWRSYEAYNCEWFGTPLPMSMREDDDTPLDGVHPARIRHLLWIMYPELRDGLVLAPLHQDPLRATEAAHQLLSKRMSSLPRDVGAKRFLATPNERGWDVKRKLIWLGTRSYLFRLLFRNHVADACDGGPDIGHTDDFICSQCTRWSGLGVPDILAHVLDISEGDRATLCGWYERHLAPYRILSASSAMLCALNVINDQQYTVRLDMEDSPFREGQLIYGSLVPWRGEWYWSGTQHVYGEPTQALIDESRDAFIRRSSRIVCRYWEEYEQKVRERARCIHEEMMEYHGSDLVVYPDGLSMAAGWQQELRRHYESKPRAQVEAVIARHGLENGRPRMSIPDDLLNATGGIGVFLNPDEGKEIMREFSLLVTALERKGVALTEDEAGVVRGFIQSDAVSPRFVRRMVDEYGAASIRAAFMLPERSPGYWLDYLLRCYKGHFFRRRYPTLSLV